MSGMNNIQKPMVTFMSTSYGCVLEPQSVFSLCNMSLVIKTT